MGTDNRIQSENKIQESKNPMNFAENHHRWPSTTIVHPITQDRKKLSEKKLHTLVGINASRKNTQKNNHHICIISQKNNSAVI